MQKWEYICVSVQHRENIHMRESERFEILLNGKITIPKMIYTQAYDYFNKLGEEGWEMVAVNQGGFYFKRPLE
jgi:hypothetical protein